MTEEAARAITTLSAVVLGFVLSQGSEWLKGRRRAASRRKAVRGLIDLEANSNSVSVREFWTTILGRMKTGNENGGAFPPVELAREASKVPFPPLDIGAWQANLAEVPSAYSEPEFERIWRFQRSLRRLQDLHRFFCEAAGERRDSYRAAKAEGHIAVAALSSGIGFTDSVATPAKEFKELVEEVVAFVVPRAQPSDEAPSR